MLPAALIMDIGAIVWQAFEVLIRCWFAEITDQWLGELTESAGDLIETGFYIENMPVLTGGIVTETAINSAVNAIYLWLLSLLAIKLCWKGYKIHVLDLDGDSDNSPLTLLKNAGYALLVAAAFPYLYKIATELTTMISDTIFAPFSDYDLTNIFTSLKGIFPGMVTGSTLLIILGIIYMIVALLLWIRIVMQGFELLIFRLGVPIAVIGLVDSDGGIWKGYIQQFFRQLATIIIQSFCVKLSIMAASGLSVGPMVGAIALLVIAFRMPKILSSMLVSSGGGGGSMYALSMAARAFVKGG